MTDPIPQSLSKNGAFWFLRHIHRNCTVKNKHFSLLMCGESGKGKSWDSIAISMSLYPQYQNKESVFFSPLSFLEATEKKHPKLFPYIIDDAGLSAFSGDALASQVKNISKIAQSIRHTNCQIIFNLPHIDLLAKSVRITNHYYAEPLWIDYTNKLNYIKFQRLKMFKDNIYYKSIITNKRWLNERTGYYHTEKQKHLNFPIPAPPKEITDEYESLKEQFMEHYRTETADSMRMQKAKELGRDANKVKIAADAMRDNIDKFTNIKGRPDIPLIMESYGLAQNSARIAYTMAMMPKDKAAVDKGIKKMKEAQKKGISWDEISN
jgi:hypothetical protein